VEVTPFYLREPISRKSDIIRILNRLLEWDGRGWGCLLTEEIIEFHTKWAQILPQNLWGGQDPERIDSLVTGDLPRKRLVWQSEPEDREELGGLLYWLTTRAKRVSKYHLELTPSRIGRANARNQPTWLERTTWVPYLIRE
jgi:hypothetical protein